MASDNEEAAKPPEGYGHPPAHTRFQKGQSGNPGGRRKGKHFSGMADALKQALEEPCDVTTEPATRFEALARVIVAQAERDRHTLKLLLHALK